MWIFTETGFVSAVRHFDDPNLVVVRARDAQSLQVLAELTETPVEKSPENDYPYRVNVKDETFKFWLSTTVDMLDYTNFKSRVAVSRGDDYAHALMSVWSDMHEVEDAQARSRLSVQTQVLQSQLSEQASRR